MPNDRCVAASARAARAARSPIAIPPAGRSSARVRSRTLSGSFELQTSLAFGHPGPSQAFRIFKRSAPSSISDFENCSAPPTHPLPPSARAPGPMHLGRPRPRPPGARASSPPGPKRHTTASRPTRAPCTFADHPVGIVSGVGADEGPMLQWAEFYLPEVLLAGLRSS